jgi:hypothetical protein
MDIVQIISIEPTPSPNSMKINLDTRLSEGVRHAYTSKQIDKAPEPLKNLLTIPGVSGVFHTADFIAIDREPKADWQGILTSVRERLGEGSEQQPKEAPTAENAKDEAIPDNHFGEVQVLVQKFRGIPLQIRIKSEEQEERVAMPSSFIDAAMKAQYGSPNMIAERVLEDYGIRYGDRKELAELVLQELEAAYDEERLAQLTEAALKPNDSDTEKQPEREQLEQALKHDNWKIRYAALDRLKPDIRYLPLIIDALNDDNFSIRRLATVYLGDIKEDEVLPYLYKMLRDASASVRRTAGDCLSDIGNPDAIGPMCAALRDTSKIVRWRAARFLFETGDEQAISALQAAKDDPEFEIRMQIEYALARIEGGEAASGSVWQQMTQRNRD